MHPELKRKGKGKTRKIAGLDKEEQEEGEDQGSVELFSVDVCTPCTESKSISSSCSSCPSTTTAASSSKGESIGEGNVASNTVYSVSDGTHTKLLPETFLNTFNHIPTCPRCSYFGILGVGLEDVELREGDSGQHPMADSDDDQEGADWTRAMARHKHRNK